MECKTKWQDNYAKGQIGLCDFNAKVKKEAMRIAKIEDEHAKMKLFIISWSADLDRDSSRHLVLDFVRCAKVILKKVGE